MNELPDNQQPFLESEPQETPWVSFSLEDQKFDVVVVPEKSEVGSKKIVDTPASEYVNIYVFNADDTQRENPDGHILGKLTQDFQKGEYFFKSLTAANNGLVDDDDLEIKKKPEHVSGLVRETIKQLVLSGKISEWSSASLVTPGGEKMYFALEKEPSLNVVRIEGLRRSDGTPTYSWKVTRSIDE